MRLSARVLACYAGALLFGVVVAGDARAAATRPVVQVITEPALLEAARRAATRPADDDPLAHLETPEYWDWGSIARLKLQQAKLLPRLRDIAGAKTDPAPSRHAQITAAALLWKFGEAWGRDRLDELVKDAGAATARHAILTVDTVRLGRALSPPPGPVFARLLVAQIENPDHTVARPAMDLRVMARLADAAEPLRRLMRQRRPDRAWLAFQLSHFESSPEAIDLLIKLLSNERTMAEPLQAHWVTTALAAHARGAGGDARSDAVRAMREYFDAHAGHTDAGRVIDALNRHPVDDPRVAGMLREASTSLKGLMFTRAYAVRTFAQLRGTASLPFLRQTVRDGDYVLQWAAIEAIGEVAAGSADAALAAELKAAPLHNGQPWEPYVSSRAALAMALARIGGPAAHAHADAMLAALPPYQRPLVAWRLKNWSTRDVFQRAVDLELLSALPDKLPADRPGDRTGYATTTLTLLYDALTDAGRCYFPMGYSRVSPPRYEALVSDFAAFTGGLLAPQAISQSEVPATTPATRPAGQMINVQFIESGRLFRFQVRNLGGTVDHAPVADAINAALEARGLSRRIFRLEDQAYSTRYLIGEPEQIRHAARELSLPLAGEPDGPNLRAGAAF